MQQITYSVDCAVYEQPVCSICREEYILGEVITKLACEHIFHTDCCANWSKCCVCQRQIECYNWNELQKQTHALAQNLLALDPSCPSLSADICALDYVTTVLKCEDNRENGIRQFPLPMTILAELNHSLNSLRQNETSSIWQELIERDATALSEVTLTVFEQLPSDSLPDLVEDCLLFLESMSNFFNNTSLVDADYRYILGRLIHILKCKTKIQSHKFQLDKIDRIVNYQFFSFKYKPFLANYVTKYANCVYRQLAHNYPQLKAPLDSRIHAFVEKTQKDIALLNIWQRIGYVIRLNSIGLAQVQHLSAIRTIKRIGLLTISIISVIAIVFILGVTATRST